MKLQAQTLAVVMFFAKLASAAPPPVNLSDDPRLLRCSSTPAGAMKTTGVVFSDDTSVVYEAAFDPIEWIGSLKKRRVGFDPDGTVAAQQAEWDAADVLATSPPHTRHIYTSDVNNATIPFDWQYLSGSQKVQLNTSPLTGMADNLGAQRLQYLCGERSAEQALGAGPFRHRRKLLGAIINSTPVFVGPPSSALLESGYQAFYQSYRQRPATVLVGADDGMLHAFDASSGRELFAYVPRSLIPVLSQLTRPDAARRAYVDGPIRIAEARMGSEWKTVLVAAMRGGAQGVFALDVTDASRFGQGMGALWEFTDADDPHMGNVVGAPAIAKFYIGVRKGLPTYRYFAIVSAGVNNYVEDGAGRSDSNGTNALFLLALDKPPSEKWKAGSNYYKFVLPPGEPNMANGLSEPTLVKDGEGVARHVYVGDLQGNLWRFDFTGVSPWTAAMGTGTPKPIFAASDEQGHRQPITARPAIVFATSGYLLLFGTGRLLESGDLTADTGNMSSFYAVQDDPDKRRSTIRRNELIKRNADALANGGVKITGTTIPRAAGEKGWYVDLPNGGERVLSAAEILGHFAYFDTVTPSVDPCRPPIGRSYVVDTLSGLPPTNVVTGLPFDPAKTYGPVTIPAGSSAIAPRDASGKMKIEIRRVRVTAADTKAAPEKAAASDGNAPAVQSMTAGRLSWRELVDWNGTQK